MDSYRFIKNVSMPMNLILLSIIGFWLAASDVNWSRLGNDAQVFELQRLFSGWRPKQTIPETALTVAVARVVPSVVSIVATRKVFDSRLNYSDSELEAYGLSPKDLKFFASDFQRGGYKEERLGIGTGFFVTADGYIVTNRHVVSDSGAIYTAFLANGEQKQAKIVFVDEKNDLAILKVPGHDYPYVALGDSSTLQLGQDVFAVGNALGEYNNSVSVGIIAGLNRNIEAFADNGSQKEQLTGVIQTDAAINVGNSGGPLANTKGEVVGINVATVIGSNNISFALPINSVKKIILTAVKK